MMEGSGARSVLVTSVADPGSGAFLTPGSGIRYRFFPGPGSQTHIFESLVKIEFLKLIQIFFRHFKNKIIFNFVKFVATKKCTTANFFSPLSFVAVFVSGIRDPGRIKIRILDKYPGSATLLVTNGSGCGSGRSKNIRIRIPNTGECTRLACWCGWVWVGGSRTTRGPPAGSHAAAHACGCRRKRGVRSRVFLLILPFEGTFTSFVKDNKSKKSHRTAGIKVFLTIFAYR